jgi:hypothetical protein
VSEWEPRATSSNPPFLVMFRCAIVNDILQNDMKVKRPFMVTLNRIDIFEWCGVRWGSRNGQPQNMFKRLDYVLKIC